MVEAFIPQLPTAFGHHRKKRTRCMMRAVRRIVGLALILELSLIGLVVGETSTVGTIPRNAYSKSHIQENRRVDCYPESSSPRQAADRDKCEARGCVWSPSAATPAAPACYFPGDGARTGLKVTAEKDVKDGKRWMLQVKSGSRYLAGQIVNVSFTVRELSDNVLQFKFEDTDDLDSYQVPLTLTEPDLPVHSQRYSYEVTKDPFSFKVTRKDTGAIIWDTSGGVLLFADQLLQISTLLPSNNVFGLGENGHSTFRHDMNFRSWPLFSRDQLPGNNENPLHSVYPFYECVEEDGKAHGVFLLNSNAMEYAFTPAPMLTYRTVGGILDFYVMMGPSPENVIQQYTGLIGRPNMPPYWALGFHLSRYGYNGTEDMRAAVRRTLDYNISVAQDAGYYGDEVTAASREAMRTLYRLLPFLYTLFHKAHAQGHTVIRPLFHEFPHEAATLGVDKQFLWGPALLISPTLEEKLPELVIYVPGGRWYDYYTGVVFSEEAGTKRIAVTRNSQIPLHIRGGFILPKQEPANNTRFSRLNNFALTVALDTVDGAAAGDLFWDDGESINTFESGAYFSAYFSSQENKLHMHITHRTSEVLAAMGALRMDEVLVLGVSAANYVYINGQLHGSYGHNATTGVLTITDMGLPLTSEFSITWSVRPAVTASDHGRVDCCSEGGCDVTSCTAKGCLWEPSGGDNVPWCFIDSSTYGYDVEGAAPGAIKEGRVNLVRRKTPSLYGGDVDHIAMSVTQSEHAVRIKIYDPAEPRYEVPVASQLSLPPGDSGLSLVIQSEPFSFSVKRDSDSVILWDSAVGGLTFADQFLQIAARIHCESMQGLGEHIHPHLSHAFTYRTWPMFARDQPPSPNANLYGVHPFYMCIEKSGKSHGVLLLNSNAMEVALMPDPGIVFKTTGGILDLIIINGESGDATQLLSSYISIIGKPFLPPYWALGFHLSRYGYNTMDNLRAVVERNIEAGLPYDVQHLDIDTMDERKTFTIDPVNFKGLPEFSNELRQKGIKTFVILDPFLVSNYTDYEPYTRGASQDVFMKWPQGMNPDREDLQTDLLLGWCWPKGRVVFPDFFHPNGSTFWQDLITTFYTDGMTFDGVWLDMNEPSNFGTNEDRAFNWPEKDVPYWTLKCPASTWDDPPYKPKSIWGKRLSEKTICMSTLHAQGGYRHYDVHNIYGWSQTQPTLLGVQKATNTRGMLVVRSTYPSSGHYAGHWLGDNASQWPGLKDSVIGIIEFNMFGIPFVGADICGYFNDAPSDLCQRWQQLGAFYTFSRNHQGIGTKPQDPAYFGGEMLASTRRVLETRYTLLPYLYTLFFRAHLTGAPVISALSHVFTMDQSAASVDRQFMWGSHLLISPVLEQNKDKLWAYLPTFSGSPTRWYDYYTGARLDGGLYHELDVPLDLLPLHVRENSVIFTQDPAVNTQLSRTKPFGLLVTPNLQEAFPFYWDDGVSIDTVEKGEYFKAACHAVSSRMIKYTIIKDHASIDGAKLGHVNWYGVSSAPEVVTVTKGNAQPERHHNFRFYEQTQMLIIQELNINMRASFGIEIEFKQKQTTEQDEEA